MNKTISYITSLVVVVALGALYAFGKVDGLAFGTISATVLGLIYKLYKQFETGEELKIKLSQSKVINTQLVDKIKYQDSIVESLRMDNLSLKAEKEDVQPDVTSEVVTPKITKRNKK